MASMRNGLTKSLHHRILPSQLSSTSRTIVQRRHASGGEHFNEPSGMLFNEFPRKDGAKRQKEDWETIWYVGMGGGMALAFAIFWFRPDTSISSWALEEAKARLEARGDSARYIPSADSRRPS
ncbi:hypothetical protein FS842_002752 [Serendipita sp. 407]|nr:hypothetical protein FS842_002752 [Serendipita sp. 407]